MGSASVAAIAITLPLTAAKAQTQPFGSMVRMQTGTVIGTNGQVSQWTGASAPVVGTDADGRPLMTIQQNQAKALLDWEQFRLQTNEVLEFRQQSADWIAVNRVHGQQASEILGEIRAPGKVFVFDDNGVLVGNGAKINVRQLVTGKGFSDVLVDGKTTTLVQSRSKAILDWSNMSLQAGEVLKYRQEAKDWVALNRSHAAGVTTIDGNVSADGHVYLVAPKGLAVNGNVSAQQVVLSSLDISNDQFEQNGLVSSYSTRLLPTFTNSVVTVGDYDYSAVQESILNIGGTWAEASDPNDPLKYNVTIGKNARITTGAGGKIMLFGPRVVNKGILSVSDEGQVILVGGENIFLTNALGNGMLSAYSAPYSPLATSREGIQYLVSDFVENAEWAVFLSKLLGRTVEAGDSLGYEDWTLLTGSKSINGLYAPGGLIAEYLSNKQYERAHAIGYTARNEGIIYAAGGGNVGFHGLNLEQMGSIEMTSTAKFRGSIEFLGTVQEYGDYADANDLRGIPLAGNGTVTFGVNSLTQIVPDLDSKDTIAVSSGAQSVGSMTIRAGKVDMQQDSLINMPAGTINAVLDATWHVFGNRGNGGNRGNEDGTRFFMDAGATIDLSGWKQSVLDMGYHQVTGRLFAAELADSPVQRDGALYRKEISVDRRFGTDLANWQNFDNLSLGTLAQFLVDGGTFTLDVGDDFIMKPGSVIDVSGGITTYSAGYVTTTLLRRLDGTVIDIRAADPDELYMGLANEWVQYDTKWGKQQSYYIPLLSSYRGQYETSYVEGGKGGLIEVLAPDALLQGTVKGETVAGRYQRGNIPAGGVFALNYIDNEKVTTNEKEYISNLVLITDSLPGLTASFGLQTRLSDVFGDVFGDEFDPETDAPATDTPRSDNATVASVGFLNNSTMGSYAFYQRGATSSGVPLNGFAAYVGSDVQIDLQNGASFTIGAEQRLGFDGSIRTEGGNVSLSGMALAFSNTSRIDTRGSWYSDYELSDAVPLVGQPRFDGGTVSLTAGADAEWAGLPGMGMSLPKGMVIDTSGGGWVNRDGILTPGIAGDLFVSTSFPYPGDPVDLSAVYDARAFGLAGNGALVLRFSDPVYIGNATATPVEGERSAVILNPELFENSGFSTIGILAPGVALLDGETINASTASLVLRDATLVNGLPAAYAATTGTDIYDIADVRTLSIEQRPLDTLSGMNIAFVSGDYLNYIGKGSSITTQLGGKIELVGNSYVFGALTAPAGQIWLGGASRAGSYRFNGVGRDGVIWIPQASELTYTVYVGPNGKLLAPGASLVLSQGVDANGAPTRDGAVFDGGLISIIADQILLDRGSLLSVEGVADQFDRPASATPGQLVPTMVASNGGTVMLQGLEMNIDSATYRAAAGGAGAVGGTFNLAWRPRYGATEAVDPTQMVDTLESYFTAGYFFDVDGQQVSSLYGADLSRIDWANVLGASFDFAPGFTLEDRAALVGMFTDYSAAAAGAPPMLVIGDAIDLNGVVPPTAEFSPGLARVFETLFGYTLPTLNTAEPAVTVLSTQRMDNAGFSSLGIDASAGIVFNGDVTLGGKRADGSYVFDTVRLNALSFMGTAGSHVTIEAGYLQLMTAAGIDSALYKQNIASAGVSPVMANTTITAKAGTLLGVSSADFYGFSTVDLVSAGDIRFSGVYDGVSNPTGLLQATGLLRFTADQVYAGSGRIFSVSSDTGIEIRPQNDGGPINASPYEAAAELSLNAPHILQSGILRSPLGILNLNAYQNGTEGSGTVTFAAGSITSVSGEGRLIPYGYTSNGDTWINPFTGTEMKTLPSKAVNINANLVDLREGSKVDITGGGDMVAREFIQGTGGTYDWLRGYRDANNSWIGDGSGIYAVMPGYEGDIAPLSFGGSSIPIGAKVYLPGGSGLAAGYYVLLPAEYALLPGAYRVTLNHREQDTVAMAAGEVRNLSDASSIQAGYQVSGITGQSTSGTLPFLVMSGTTLRARSTYIETSANGYFSSEAYLKKAERINRELLDLPRRPLDGGSLSLTVASELRLDGSLLSGAAKGGRDGLFDISSSHIVVAGSHTDLSQYAGYLALDSDQLSSFGAESILIGGTRSQTENVLQLTVGATDLVIDNAGSTLKAPDIILAASGRLDVLGGASVEAAGTITGAVGDIHVSQLYATAYDDDGTPDYIADDATYHGALDAGALVHLSVARQVDIVRDQAAVDAYAQLMRDPEALAAANAGRAKLGLAPLVAYAGLLTINEGSSLIGGHALALDATDNAIAVPGATLRASQISASSSLISIGAVPQGTGGLVFDASSLLALGNAQELTLKSYSSIDIHGSVNVRAADALRLDTRELRLLGDADQAATIRANSLTLANSQQSAAVAVAGEGTLTLSGATVRLEGGDKALSGIDRLVINADQRLIGSGTGTLHVPGSVAISAGAVTAESGQRLAIDATGDIAVAFNGATALPVFDGVGGAVTLAGSTIDFDGQIRMIGGQVNLTASDGDLRLRENARIDVTSGVATFYDVSVGVAAGTVNLTAARGDIALGQGSVIDVSGAGTGGDAGTLNLSAGLGDVRFDGIVKGQAGKDALGGTFSLLTGQIDDFGAFDAKIAAAGFDLSRRYEFNAGDVVINSVVRAQNFTLLANAGTVTLTGAIETTGANGGRVQLAAAGAVTLAGSGRIAAGAKATGGSGGTVVLETAGANGGVISIAAGAVIDVSGEGEGGRTVRLRAPQLGSGDVAIGTIAGSFTGARSVTAEAYRVYDNVSTIDRALIDRVSADATTFFGANGTAIQARLGSQVSLIAGIELRNAGDMQLATDWDLSGLRFNGAAGALTLRAAGDLRIDANLSDGFVGTQLLSGDSWSFNLTAGANIASPNSMAVLPTDLLAAGKGSLIIGGKADTIEYYYDPAYGNENRLYIRNSAGGFARDTSAQPSNFLLGFIELQRDAATGKYIDPTTGALIEKDPVTGDYTDTAVYGRRPLAWIHFASGGAFARQAQDGSIISYFGAGIDQNDVATIRPFAQWNNATGYSVRTGTGAIGLSAARDLVLEQRPSVVYTAGRAADALPGFYAPPKAVYGTQGGDIRVEVGRDIVADPRTPQLPSGYLRQSVSMNGDLGTFDAGTDRAFQQSTWWIDHSAFEGGLGALGGGNIDIAARGDVRNLGVAIPTSGRVTGGTFAGDPLELHTLGGGNLTLLAGGDVAGGAFYVGDGLGTIIAGGALTSGSQVHEYTYSCRELNANIGTCNMHYDPIGRDLTYDLYPMLFTSSGQLTIRAAGDLNIEGVFDPLLLGSLAQLNDGTVTRQGRQDMISYTAEASLSLFSSGGDVTMWNNDLNVLIAHLQSVPDQLQYLSSDVAILGSVEASDLQPSIGWLLRPSTISAIAAAGDVSILGGIVMMPSPTGNLDLLAGDNIVLGYETEARAEAPRTGVGNHPLNYRTTSYTEPGILMSQADIALLPTPDNIAPTRTRTLIRENFLYAGHGNISPAGTYFTEDNLPDLHVGDVRPARIYAARGDIVSDNLAILTLPKSAWVQANGSIYFPSFSFQHNQATDLSLLRAGDGIYFSHVLRRDVRYLRAFVDYGYVNVFGPGRLEVEAGGDIYLPDNSLGITTDRIQLYPVNTAVPAFTPTAPWHPDENAADIAISAGFNQAPSYAAFEAAYLDPLKADGMAEYVIDEASGKSLYLFDRDYPRAQGATGEFAVPEPREGLVNYVRRLQGLAPLETREAEQGYLDTAWAYWQTLSTDYKTPFYRSILFMETRSSGREANDPKSDRYGSAQRGYDAIATLFPGAQKAADEALAEGESRWNGDFETYASRVVSFGGGKVELVIPGGKVDLANVAAANDQTGQPSLEQPRGDAMRAGIITADGGEVNILAHNSVILNNSRLLTTKGGNVMIWSSFGDIAAGRGAKTSISPQYYDYLLDKWAAMEREPAGLPTGAGIGTLATQPGTPPADVDLVAPLGIVDAGDAGIRVSGNFNVFALQVLGLDNIEVAGIATGLPIPPAAPPTSLDTGELAAKADFADKALDDAIDRVRANNAVLSPSLIQVRVTGFEIDGCDGCADDGKDLAPGAAAAPQGPALGQQPQSRPITFDRREVDFNIPSQPLDDAIRAIAKASGFNILFEATEVVIRTAPPMQGRMTPEDALRRLLADQGLRVTRTGPRTIVLSKSDH
ncbi:hypothetical protein TS85_03900 [Sphingomonas hengshuiensis]|uniref:Filamentous haemagglutinin FhaB/tRNA nuclease CdiA-like TPS domain-containing protein n=1 Tax=Sphingomonas hengshuiensis TaxID=1609977 RepID=A0A7U4J6H4_9SPHN|nr:hypothetical protein TS85_03900 [Sphingomonas hengshuiensis]